MIPCIMGTCIMGTEKVMRIMGTEKVMRFSCSSGSILNDHIPR